MRLLPLVILSLSVGLLACNPFGATSNASQNAQAENAPVPAPSGAAPGAAPPTLAPMLAKVSPAVVNISVRGTRKMAQNPMFQDPFFRRFFNLPQGPTVQQFQAVGSGVIYDAAKGYVITNNHVVQDADKILVTLKDRRQLDAKLVATDPQTDIAVLKVNADNLTALPLGNSDTMKVGDYVVAIGDPFGLGQTATFGIVSALERTGLGIEGYEDFIQTDASINPGNSGGALVDMSGHLIGINAAILSRSGGNVGIGFAIPINMVKNVATQLIANGKVSRGELGVTIQDMTPALAQAMGVKTNEGAVVADVKPGTPAAKAGMKAGDIITKLDGVVVPSSAQLRNDIGAKPPGTTVHLTVLRDGEQRTITATLIPQSKQEAAAGGSGVGSQEDLGLSLGPIPQDDPLYGEVKGAYVEAVEQGSAAEDAGIQQGDIITSVAKRQVSNPAEAARLLRQRTKGKPVLVQIRRGDQSLYVAIG